MRARAPLSKWMLTQIASDCTEVSWHTPFIVTEIRRYSSNWLSLPALPLVPAVKWHVVVLKGKGSDEQYCARKRSTTQCCEYRGCRSIQACSVPVCRCHRRGAVAVWGRGCWQRWRQLSSVDAQGQSALCQHVLHKKPPELPTPPCPAAWLLHMPHSQARHSLLHRPVRGLQPEFSDLIPFKHLVYFKPQGHIQKAEWGNFTPPML